MAGAATKRIFLLQVPNCEITGTPKWTTYKNLFLRLFYSDCLSYKFRKAEKTSAYLSGVVMVMPKPCSF